MDCYGKISPMFPFLKRHKKILIFLVIFLASSVFFKFKVFSSKENAESATVVYGALKKEVSLSGKIDAEEHAVLQFQTAGRISWVGVKEGDYVQKNQSIASLDQGQIKKTLDKYLNTYLKTRQDFDQIKADNPDEALYTDEIKRIVQKSQVDLNNSVIDVELQDIALRLANISTPIEGIVTRIDTPYAGVNIYSPAQAQFEIVNPNTIDFEVNADQTEVINLKEGSVGEIVFDSYPDEKVRGVVKNISFTPKKDETGTVYTVKVALPNETNENYKYKMGMTGDITFVTEERKNALYMPVRFLKSDNKGKYVLIGEKKEKVYVKTGLETDNDIQILDGLSKGDAAYD